MSGPADIADRTAVLEARDLHQRLHQVWRLNSMGELAAGLAHELNQPLTAALVYLHAGQADLERAGASVGPFGDSAARSLEMAKTQLLRAGEIIRRTREMVSSGARSFAPERVSSMVEDLGPIFAVIVDGTSVTIRIDVDDGDDRVLADRIQVQQAIANLVRNAIDAVADRPDASTVAVIGRDQGKAGYRIVVEDDGPGVPEDDVERIFRPMVSTKAGGMGLGLSVTRSIVESHGGRLTVGRADLGGAAFAFILPRVTEPEAG